MSSILDEIKHQTELTLRAHGIDETQAADLRARFKTFAEDWNRPEADIYDEDPPQRCHSSPRQIVT